MGSLMALGGIYGFGKGFSAPLEESMGLEGHGMRSPTALGESMGIGCGPQWHCGYPGVLGGTSVYHGTHGWGAFGAGSTHDVGQGV